MSELQQRLKEIFCEGYGPVSDKIGFMAIRPCYCVFRSCRGIRTDRPAHRAPIYPVDVSTQDLDLTIGLCVDCMRTLLREAEEDDTIELDSVVQAWRDPDAPAEEPKKNNLYPLLQDAEW